MGAHSRSYEIMAVRSLILPLVKEMLAAADKADPMTRQAIHIRLSKWEQKVWGKYLDQELEDCRKDYPNCEIQVSSK